jgi:3-phosphoshikimate 1-carboxyvinyltransferase
MNYTVKNKIHQGTIHIPPSKSDSQRAILIAALGSETSVLQNVGSSDDELAMIENVQKLGAEIHWIDKKTLSIKGNFTQASFSELNCGESGLGLRLLTSITTLKTNEVKLTGSGSLKTRNQSFFEQFLPKMKVKIQSNDGKLPLLITGQLKSGNYTVDGSDSSQYISGLLIAFSQIEGTTILKVENCSSKPYIDMTVYTLNYFGIQIDETEHATYKINGIQPIQKTNYTIDGDWSSASYWLVASALGLDINVKGLSMASKQADKAILNAFLTANCQILNLETGLKIDGKKRKPLDFDATNCPDLFPALVTYATLTEGISKIKGVHRLANKESNRGEALKQEFEKLGIRIFIENDTLMVEGKTHIQSAIVSSHNDHRIAMCLAITSIVSSVEISIEDANAVTKSYPKFWTDLEYLSC